MFFMKINEIPPLEHDFTEVLKTLALIPKMLYFYGKLPENMPIIGRKKCVAIVGSRKNTSYGREVAYQAAYEAAKAGAIVISGLAYGIDSIAHRGALDAGGITIAVLGTPIDDIYPKAHIGLAREIIEKDGAIISEYGPGEISHSKGEVQARFLARNRIIAGLSDVTLITEAADRSGSLNTASHALDIGSDLMAVPGDITRLTSRGCNRLLMQGAIPYTEPNDLLDLLFPERLIEKKSGKCNLGGANCNGENCDGNLSESDEELLRQLLEKYAETEVEWQILTKILCGTRDGDHIIEQIGISASDFSQAITMLEIKGAVKSLGANNWMGVIR
ncbi:DNA-processing protein DprA [Candidatus Saccharibacteria bacterium]|nr:DNA-processing protein DprA [Candidatus Saccharibacteria bacterium]